MITKLFTVTVQMKDDRDDPDDPGGLTEHIKEMLHTAEIRSERGKVDFMIKRITVRSKSISQAMANGMRKHATDKTQAK